MADSAVNIPVRRILLSASVSDDSVGKAIREMFTIEQEKSADRIELWVSTHGGGIDAGFALIDVIRELSIPVDTITTGCAMSMGIPILQAGQRRYATQNSRLMIHPATSGFSGRINEGIETVKDSMKLERRMHKYVADRVGMTLSDYMKFMGDAKYMSPKQALKYNFIDEIRPSPGN